MPSACLPLKKGPSERERERHSKWSTGPTWPGGRDGRGRSLSLPLVRGECRRRRRRRLRVRFIAIIWTGNKIAARTSLSQSIVRRAINIKEAAAAAALELAPSLAATCRPSPEDGGRRQLSYEYPSPCLTLATPTPRPMLCRLHYEICRRNARHAARETFRSEME